MSNIVIQGGKELSGKITVNGAKNAVLPIFAATLIAEGEYLLHNVPNLKDIETLSALLRELGLVVEKVGEHDYKIINNGITKVEAPYELVKEMRASFLVMGPLLANKKQARVALPGGCAIGTRPVDIHLKGFEALGATVKMDHGFVEVSADELQGANMKLDFPTVTGTENIVMAAVLAKGQTIIRNVAKEPEIVNMCEMLNAMGAKISGAGTDKIVIEGVEKMNACEFTIVYDRIEAGTFIILSALTNGGVEVENVNLNHLEGFVKKLENMGVEVTEEDGLVKAIVKDKLKATKITTECYPGFPTDLQAQIMVLMSHAHGVSKLKETIFENRFMHVQELDRMGAKIEVEGKTAVIEGGIKFSGAEVKATDLRAGASLVLAGLIAENTTIISDIYHIERGYEDLVERLQKLGANIKYKD